MREKIKITIPLKEVEPDPPPFRCDVCGEETPYWLIKHSGEKKMCALHTRKNGPIPFRDRYQFNYNDFLQLDAIYSVIGAIQDEPR